MNDHPIDTQPKRWLGHFIKKFLPVFGLIALLPLMMVALLSSEPFSLSSRADKNAELRVWFEPAAVITQPGQNITLKIMAEFDQENKIMPSVTVSPQTELGVVIEPVKIIYNRPFHGQVSLGSIEVVANEAGTYAINLPDTAITTSYTEKIDFITSSASLVVKTKL